MRAQLRFAAGNLKHVAGHLNRRCEKILNLRRHLITANLRDLARSSTSFVRMVTNATCPVIACYRNIRIDEYNKGKESIFAQPDTIR